MAKLETQAKKNPFSLLTINDKLSMKNFFMKKSKLLDTLSQFCIPFFTLGGQLLLALKFPQWALVSNLIAQPFWLYASWKSYKYAGQIGILITTLVFTIITIVGIINYWK